MLLADVDPTVYWTAVSGAAISVVTAMAVIVEKFKAARLADRNANAANTLASEKQTSDLEQVRQDAVLSRALRAFDVVNQTLAKTADEVGTLHKQNAEQAIQMATLEARVNECDEKHAECEEKHAATQAEVAALKTTVNAIQNGNH